MAIALIAVAIFCVYLILRTNDNAPNFDQIVSQCMQNETDNLQYVTCVSFVTGTDSCSITSDMEYCRNKILMLSALKGNNRTICNGISDQREMEACSIFFDEERDCRFQENPDVKLLCESLEGMNGGHSDFADFMTAVNSNNIAACNMITSDSDKALCKAILSGDESHCRDMLLSSCTDGAYMEMYEHTGNKDICNLIDDQDTREMCMSS